MDIREKVISEYPLTEKVTNLIKTIPCKRDAFDLTKSKCIIFHDDYIDKENIVNYTEELSLDISKGTFPKKRVFIVVAKTKETAFEKDDLILPCMTYRNPSTVDNIIGIVNFILINEETKHFFCNKKWFWMLGYNYKRFVRRIEKILNGMGK